VAKSSPHLTEEGNTCDFFNYFTNDNICDEACIDKAYIGKPQDNHTYKQEMVGNNHEGIHLRLDKLHSQKLKL